MPELELLVKKVALLLSDSVSNQLQTHFTCRFFAKKQIPFQAIQKLESDYFTFSLFNLDKSPVLIAVDSAIIYQLSNRLLGGDGAVEYREKIIFTPSDYALGHHLVNWTRAAFRKLDIDLVLGKEADSPKFFHLFLPDELVWQVAFEVKIDSHQAGMIFLCVDRDFQWESIKETSE